MANRCLILIIIEVGCLLIISLSLYSLYILQGFRIYNGTVPYFTSILLLVGIDFFLTHMAHIWFSKIWPL